MKTEIETGERQGNLKCGPDFLITSKALAIPPIEKNPTVLRSTVTEKPVLTASQGTKASMCSKLRHNFLENENFHGYPCTTQINFTVIENMKDDG